MEKLRVAIFGAGRMGLFYIRLLLENPNCTLCYIVVKSEDTVIKLKNLLILPTKCNIVTVKDAETVYNDSSPTHAHDEQVKRCLQSGMMSVYCEKPISFNEQTTIDCYKMADEKKLHLFCAFQRRFDDSFRNAFDTVRAGSLGKVHFIKSCSRDGSLPDIEYLKTSGGFFKDSTVHDIDMICWIAEEYPETVFAQGHAHRPEFQAIDDYDSITVTMKFSSGLIGIIDQDRCAVYGYDQRLEIFGENGMIKVENPLLHQAQSFTTRGITSPRIVNDFLTRYKEAYEKQLLHFFSLITSNSGTAINGKHVLQVEKIAKAAWLSCKSNKIIDMKNF